ncbi:predicted protein [Nematostella vectensis]|uniref:Uncharacterized protein n=1 Tax=Nematostella vectensis TaxID=45351 RepID=A7SZS3_NEMVE|nr:predicted protein [Nematostella vectensis]|eukprot:XP_001622905.1 predicted protein [Nematostella vectensis]
MDNIRRVEERVENWYQDLDRSSYSTYPNSLSNVRAEKWKSLQKTINDAHILYEALLARNGISKKGISLIIKPALFSRNSPHGKTKKRPGANKVEKLKNTIEYYDKMKFSFMTEIILQPLAIDFILKSREKEIRDMIQTETPFLRASATVREQAIERIAGTSKAMKNMLNGVTTEDDLEKAIGALNEERRDRVITMLKYLYDQGMAEGSALGSLDHEWNMNAAGFQHGVFAVRKHLEADFLDKMIKACKWFNDFNEVYGKSSTHGFEFDGTTSDQMKVHMFFRILTVLSMPEDDNDKKKKKIRDMHACKDNADNSMAINLGLGGVFKPDGSSFHHQTYYGAAYAPYAVQTASIVQFILDGTKFQLGVSAVKNLHLCLETYRAVAVKYSTPSSLAGRFPNYKKEVLASIIPAYAYIACKEATTRGCTKIEDTGMLLRLYYKTSNPTISDTTLEKRLQDGSPSKGSYYLNTIGSLDILQWVVGKAGGEAPETTPSGHWSLNFAGLSVQRRDQWAVAAKGFNKNVWDFESGGKENLYGLFESHGTLQISNDEESLIKYDVENGWDWTLIPGATAVNISPKHLELKSMRFYNKKTLAGGVSLCGAHQVHTNPLKCEPRNGVFAMHYDKPDYETKEQDSPAASMTFEFKKSYVFFNNLIVCLVSDVEFRSNAKNTYHAHTALFQEKDTGGSIKVEGVDYKLSGSDQTFDSANMGTDVTLEDTSGNIYSITDVQNNGRLHVKISDQQSKTDQGKNSKGRYATAWVQHPDNATPLRYNILVNGGPLMPGDLRKVRILQDRGNAHIVELDNLPSRGSKIFAYSIFEPTITGTATLGGPVNEVTHECTMMLEKGPKYLIIALSNPGFKLVRDPNKEQKVPCENTPDSAYEEMSAQSDVTKEILYCSKSDSQSITVTLQSKYSERKGWKVESVWVNNINKKDNPSDFVTQDRFKLEFKKLENGFTTEVKLVNKI